ncbi:MAG: porphobilinogen synthase [Chitinophagaceae bacterium]
MHLTRRNRILRSSSSLRSLVAETHLSPRDLMAPLFICEGSKIREEISSMPDYFRNSLDQTLLEIRELWELGIRSILLFVKVPDELKDNLGTEALNSDGLMQRSIKEIKNSFPEMVVFTDVALDPYSSFGHDGIVLDHEILNDPTVEVLARMSLSHAKAGADFVAPSDMMDGRIGAIRNILEDHDFSKVGIMSYSAKYASCLYGPFRDALESAPGFGDKKTYQMDFANSREALKETLMDVEEGADIVMIKPALPYLDIIWRIKEAVDIPVSAYQVSGEYAMIKAASKMGWLEEKMAILETLTCIKRSGADLIATYFAKEAAKLIS